MRSKTTSTLPTATPFAQLESSVFKHSMVALLPAGSRSVAR
jgi:hypothetical protein